MIKGNKRQIIILKHLKCALARCSAGSRPWDKGGRSPRPLEKRGAQSPKKSVWSKWRGGGGGTGPPSLSLGSVTDRGFSIFKILAAWHIATGFNITLDKYAWINIVQYCTDLEMMLREKVTGEGYELWKPMKYFLLQYLYVKLKLHVLVTSSYPPPYLSVLS